MPQADRVLVRLEKLADVSYQFIDVIPYVFLWELNLNLQIAIHIPVLSCQTCGKTSIFDAHAVSMTALLS